MCYSVQSKGLIFVKSYGLLLFFFSKNMGKDVGKNISENLSSKYSKVLLGHATKSA